jgi:predicted component of viral defense system (DUF524 family)
VMLPWRWHRHRATAHAGSVRSTFDVPENRFVKAFIEQAIGIVEHIQVQAAGRGSSLAARIEGDCAHMLQRLEPLLRTGLLAGVGQMRRLRAESMVLQRRGVTAGAPRRRAPPCP